MARAFHTLPRSSFASSEKLENPALAWAKLARDARGFHSARSGFPARHITVESIVAQWFSAPPLRTNTSALQTFSVFPERTTRARAINSSPSAGASKFILYSTVRTEASAGMSV